ncbi:PfaD family polyunsaturated fatty acid/polyketide biosynthesis protein [Shewanella sp. 3B26]|uniref:PfaD family polyunsaturated fatty acid/polyketide biosynthesis protein n=1 Tax=Shewanella zhuhaiensis TaxID=2919576 RepID=A0AAJ1EX32_9GAMM|nr:PfaD family polyunsaturated fatty acid/polyketide biosynthesis protein [Shewanella zhuhaiensis]MCH4293524.1 PfaD family polyunsaturated fatty acid/polyketide biosynthesis protein [Shewanella zhuhaiensis]
MSTAFKWPWAIDQASGISHVDAFKSALLELNKPLYVARLPGGELCLSHDASEQQAEQGREPGLLPVAAFAAPFAACELGSEDFRRCHGVKYAYYAGAMANGIASEELVIALGKAGILCSFGAAGLVPARVEAAIKRIQAELPQGPYAFNLIHSPSEPALEQGAVELYLKHGVHTVEASAFLALTPHIVRYRAAGLSRDKDGNIVIKNKVVAKISRTEVASHFMKSAPKKMLDALVAEGHISTEQAELALLVPMADDITAEADSGGHTDNRPLVTLLPTILALRDELQAQHAFATPIRVGAGGGIGTPDAALAAFNMGADFIVTGSINQACIEAGASEHTRKLLATTEMADVTMAPAADMFEMGVKLQVVKRGTLFPMRANKLYELYSRYDSIEAIPADERTKLEAQVFRASLDDIWQGTVAHFMERDPAQIQRAEGNPKRKMALIFRWYLGLSSRWSNTGEAGREMDYQIWAGPALGAFNGWSKGTYLDDYRERRAVDLALHLLSGAAYLHRVNTLKAQGVVLPSLVARYRPLEPLA